MCQAYAAEKAAIITGEDYATIAGFTAARNGASQSSNPYGKLEEHGHDAWDHGWGCWHERILPWALERNYHRDGRIAEAQKARQQFKLTGELPPELINLLHT